MVSCVKSLISRRAEMQELKRVQREESRQIQELEQSAASQNELQERKQQQERAVSYQSNTNIQI